MNISVFFQVLDAARRRLAAVLQERSRVLDLVCSTMPSGARSANRFSKLSMSADQGLKRMATSADGFRQTESPDVDPLGSFTPEVENALLEAKEARSRLAYLLQFKIVILKGLFWYIWCNLAKRSPLHFWIGFILVNNFGQIYLNEAR